MSGVRARKAAVALVTALLLLYLVMTFRQSLLLLGGGDPVAAAMGAALLVLPVLGVLLIARELRFGVQAERLLRRLEGEGGLPEDDLPRLPSGRVERAAADADFPRWKEELERSPEDWRCWFRLGLAYDAAGDRRRARAAVRRAIALARGTEA